VEKHRREVSSLVVLVAPLRRGEKPRLFARHIEGAVRAQHVIAFLRYVRWRVGRPLWLVWDRLQAHRAAAVQRFLAAHPHDFHAEYLPAYAPDLNPEEGANASVKKALLNALPTTIDELRHMARREFRRLQHRPATLRAYFDHAGLSLNATG
jgi:transposase